MNKAESDLLAMSRYGKLRREAESRLMWAKLVSSLSFGMLGDTTIEEAQQRIRACDRAVDMIIADSGRYKNRLV